MEDGSGSANIDKIWENDPKLTLRLLKIIERSKTFRSVFFPKPNNLVSTTEIDFIKEPLSERLAEKSDRWKVLYWGNKHKEDLRSSIIGRVERLKSRMRDDWYKLTYGWAGFYESAKHIMNKGTLLAGIAFFVSPNYRNDSVAQHIMEYVGFAGGDICTNQQTFLASSASIKYRLIGLQNIPNIGAGVTPSHCIDLRGCLLKLINGYGIDTSPRKGLDDALEQAFFDIRTSSTQVGKGIGVHIAKETPKAVRLRLQKILKSEGFIEFSREGCLREYKGGNGRIIISHKSTHGGPCVPTADMTPLVFLKLVEQKRRQHAENSGKSC